MGTLHSLRASRAPQAAESPQTLLQAIEALTGAIGLLLDALGGSTFHSTPAPLSPADEARIVEEATDLWDTPWESLSVRELRALIRDLPIDRTSLPAPIELMRRHELIEALTQVQSLEW
jgi:hypothetical protein